MNNQDELKLTQDDILRELLEGLKKYEMEEQKDDVFELISCVDSLVKKIDYLNIELNNTKQQLEVIQNSKRCNEIKEFFKANVLRIEGRINLMKITVLDVKCDIKDKAKSIVDEIIQKGKYALYRVSEFTGIKYKLSYLQENIKEDIKRTEATIEKLDIFGKELRMAGNQIANSFRTLGGKENRDVDNLGESSFVNGIKEPWICDKKLLKGADRLVSYAIESVENLGKCNEKEKNVNHEVDAYIEKLEGIVTEGRSEYVGDALKR